MEFLLYYFACRTTTDTTTSVANYMWTWSEQDYLNMIIVRKRIKEVSLKQF